MNPGYSIKDRIMQHIFQKAETSGALRKGMTVVAASSGNTGAATAMLCAMRGYNCIITTNKKCSAEKMDSIKAYGAQLVVGPEGVSADSPEHYMNIPATLMAQDPVKYFDVDQYDNPLNREVAAVLLSPHLSRIPTEPLDRHTTSPSAQKFGSNLQGPSHTLSRRAQQAALYRARDGSSRSKIVV